MLRNAGAKRSSLLQLVLALVVFGGAAACDRRPATSGPQVEPEAEALKAKYGPAKDSYGPEEWIVRDFFQDERDGVFLDVGANHYKSTSNTYYLERHLNWSGIAVDALQEFAADYRTFRPRTRFFAFFVDEKSNERARMWVLAHNKQIGSGEKSFAEQHGDKAQQIEVPTITLNDLLDSEKIAKIDYLSLDIELFEPKALAGFDIDRFRPRLACVEAHLQVRQQILDYFAKHRYVVVGKYLRADPNNLYFTPMP